MTTLIAIPYFGVPADYLDRAVRHALAQTADVVVLVAGDGQEPPVSIRDDRLVLGTFPTNMGTPATQQAMILGSRFRWYAPHGADDFIERDHVASLLALRHPAAGSGVIWFHQGGKVTQLRSSRTFVEFGVFDTDLLRSVGGYNAAEPCGQDSVLISVLLKTSGVRLTTRPTYHKVYRADSLTHHPATRQGSPLRVAVKERNRAAILACERIGWRHVERIRAYRESLVMGATRTMLEDRVAMVEQWLR